MNFFANCTTFDELRAEFKRLVLKHHPDRGGDEETMKQLNAAYTAACTRIMNGASATADKPWSDRKRQHWTDLNEKLRAVLEQLLMLPDIEVEITGYWFWVDGADEPARKGEVKPPLELRLRELGCRYAYGKRRWFYAGVKSKNRKEQSMGNIRSNYGSERVSSRARYHKLDEAA